MPEQMTDEQKIKVLDDMFGPEDLHVDLVPYLTEGRIGRVLSHPLMVHVLYNEVSNKMINQGYLYKKEAVAKAREETPFHHPTSFQIFQKTVVDVLERHGLGSQGAADRLDVCGGRRARGDRLIL